MNGNVDVVKELEVKNKEIYFNKLVIDLDNNFDILSLTIDNIISLFTQEMMSKVLEIECSNINRSKIKNYVTSFHSNFKVILLELVKNRRNELQVLVSSVNDIDYNSAIMNASSLIMDNVCSYLLESINELYELLKVNNDEFTQGRINEYLKNNYYKKVVLKIKELLNNTDVILINNYVESYQKYLDLNAKTLK